VLTDQTMLDLTEALVREIHLVRPEMPVILCSGYHERMGPETVSKLDLRLPAKPIDMDTLSRAVRGALEAFRRAHERPPRRTAEVGRRALAPRRSR
jgi:DNA-binding NtrC family response regulator